MSKSLKETPVPIVIARDILYSTAVRGKAIISLVGEIRREWMEHELRRKLILTDDEEKFLHKDDKYTKAVSIYSNNIQM